MKSKEMLQRLKDDNEAMIAAIPNPDIKNLNFAYLKGKRQGFVEALETIGLKLDEGDAAIERLSQMQDFGERIVKITDGKIYDYLDLLQAFSDITGLTEEINKSKNV